MSLLGLLQVKVILFRVHIHDLYDAAIDKCFYKDRLANSRDGKLQLIKTLEKIHFGKINAAFLLEGSLSADHLPPTFVFPTVLYYLTRISGNW